MTGKKKVSRASRANSPALIRQALAHPEWFHVDQVGDSVHINVNVARVPLPSRSMVATRTGVVREGPQISVVFGQTAPGMDEFSGALTIGMAAKNIQGAFSSPEFSAALEAYALAQDIVPTFRHPEPSRYPRGRVVTDRATIMAIAFADDEAEVRYFRVSPTDLRALQSGHQVDLIYPVVQIIMATGELVHLVHTLQSVLGELPIERKA